MTTQKKANKALHQTAIPLRSTAAGELGRYVSYSMSKHHHIGFLTNGQNFLESADIFNDGSQYSASPLSVHNLYFHGMELALKSFICLGAEDEKELKAIEHNFAEAWKRAHVLGIEEVFPESQELQACIAIVNPTYKGKELGDFYPGLKRLPAIRHVSNACNDLNRALVQHYRSELKNKK